MSWLYSIVFAGLLFSSDGTVPSNLNFSPAAKEPSARTLKQDETERFDQSYPLTATGRVSVSNVNGSIVVEAWDRNEVKLEAVKTADSKESLADVDIKVDARPDSFSVEADYGSWKRNREGSWKNNHRRIEVQFRLSVPRTAVLNEVETVNGSVTVSNFTNFTKISAVNGDVTATNLRGAAELSTVNGQVSADFDQLAAASRINLSTVNGRVNLVIPSDANATVKADSLNGEIKNDFGLPVRKGKYVGRDLHGRIGGGQIPIRLNSVNGPLTIGRRNDGKAVSPATNLLQQKKDDDEDWDEDSESMSPVDKDKLNRDIERAVRDSQRQTADAMKEAQKELTKVNVKELSKIKVDLDTQKIEMDVRDSLIRSKDAIVRLDNIRWQGQVPTVQKKSGTFGVKGVPKVVVDAKGCSVKVRGWDRQEVQYVLTKSSTRSDGSPLEITQEVTESNVLLRIPNNESRGPKFRLDDSSDVRIEIFVPRKSNLNITTDGEIRLDGVTGEIELNGEDEAINIRDVKGKMKLAAGDSEVRVVGFNGEFASTTVDGDVYLEGAFTSICAKASDGHVTLTVPEHANLSLVSNTEVEEDGISLTKDGDTVWKVGNGGTKYNFEFSDGNLVVRNASLLNSY
jgi:DUF4097 and DUF4098 domain-containing protein YvlB